LGKLTFWSVDFLEVDHFSWYPLSLHYTPLVLVPWIGLAMKNFILWVYYKYKLLKIIQ
jgi:hypothetical protein